MNFPDGPVRGTRSFQGEEPGFRDSISWTEAAPDRSVRRLLAAVDRGLSLLGSRGVPVPREALAEGYARYLSVEALELRDPPTSGGHHARDSQGVRYWIVGCRPGDTDGQIVVPGIPHRAFDRILLVRFDAGYDVAFAGSAPAPAFLRAATYYDDANEWTLGVSDAFWRGGSVEDLTILFRITVRRLEMGTTPETVAAEREPTPRILPRGREPVVRPRRRGRERSGDPVRTRDRKDREDSSTAHGSS